MQLSSTLKNKILDHASKSFPKESCGLIAIVKGRKHYFECLNLADTPSEHFIIDALQYQEVEDKGEIIAVVHSHPKSNPTPSQADRVACEKSGLPWYIVNPKTEEWGYCEPSGFTLPYVGREFVFGVVDCYSLCRDWYKAEFGLDLKDYERRDNFWLRNENLYLDNFSNEGFRKVPLEDLQYGDAILMNLVSPLPNHAAIYLGDQLILHHVQGRLSSRDVYGGYYGKSTACVLRHESR
jgi:proteasome lid subunit RPN8/RPN11